MRPDQDISFCKLSEHSNNIQEENKEDNDDDVDNAHDEEVEDHNRNAFLSPENLSNPLKSTSSKLSMISDRPKSAQVRNKREEIERGLIGLNIELKRIDEEYSQKVTLLLMWLKCLTRTSSRDTGLRSLNSRRNISK